MEQGRNTHQKVIGRDGKCWKGERMRDVGSLKEEEQVAVLVSDDKAQTSHLSSDSHTAEFIRNPTPASLSQ